jgi:hypothetical protein
MYRMLARREGTPTSEQIAVVFAAATSAVPVSLRTEDFGDLLQANQYE